MFLAPNPVRRYEHFLLAWPANTKISVGLLFIMVKTMMAIYQACGFFSLTNSGKVFTFYLLTFQRLF